MPRQEIGALLKMGIQLAPSASLADLFVPCLLGLTKNLSSCAFGLGPAFLRTMIDKFTYRSRFRPL